MNVFIVVHVTPNKILNSVRETSSSGTNLIFAKNFYSCCCRSLFFSFFDENKKRIFGCEQVHIPVVIKLSYIHGIPKTS